MERIGEASVTPSHSALFIFHPKQPFLRRLLTRFLGLIPSMIVAIVVGRQGINTLLVISQVVLSIVLPFTMFPLIWLTSSKAVMRVRKTPELVRKELLSAQKDEAYGTPTSEPATLSESLSSLYADSLGEGDISSIRSVDGVFDMSTEAIDSPSDAEKDKEKFTATEMVHVDTIDQPSPASEADEYVDFSNSWSITILSYVIWILIIAANGYVIVTLAIG